MPPERRYAATMKNTADAVYCSSMSKQFIAFILRWILNSLGIWVAVRIFGTGYSNAQIDSSLVAFFGAGLIFSIINATLKPIVMILSLPMILVTLGFFTIVVNGFLVWLSLMLAPGLQMTFLNSIFAGLILSLVNYVVSSVLELSYHDEREEKS